ncbi:hypothetical protein QJQ45_028325 [Haematococcus lacustris]|nr:hypothetical protein QJQ45_028325 [Haematococcus lacustris]
MELLAGRKQGGARKQHTFWDFTARQYFPLFSEAATRLLSMHVTTAAAERNWSAWGLTYEVGRAQLGIEKAEKMIYINANIPKSATDDPFELPGTCVWMYIWALVLANVVFVHAWCDFSPSLESQGLSDLHCPATSISWTAAQRHEGAVRHAPLLHFHPLETWLLTDPLYYYRAAQLYDRFYSPQPKPAWPLNASGSAQLDAALLTRSFLTVLGTPHQEAVLAGAPLTQSGASTARVFYQALDLPGGAIAFTYNLYYAHNGCGNMVLSSSAGGRTSSLEFVACPKGAHEADWERVSLVVCPDAGGGQVVAALLSQHNHDTLISCRPGPHSASGRCSFSQDAPHRLNVFVALNSHANFPAPTNGTISGVIRNDQWAPSPPGLEAALPPPTRPPGLLLDAVCFLDRTASGGPYFQPSAANIVPLPELAARGGGVNNTAQGAAGGPGGQGGALSAQEAADLEWALYPGFWGTHDWQQSGPSVTCLAPDRVHTAPCPDLPAWRLLARQLGLDPRRRDAPAPASPALGLRLALPPPGTLLPLDYHKDGGAKQGPAYRPWVQRWQGPRQPPLWELPAANMPYRLLLNGGQTQPLLTCPPAMDPAQGPLPRLLPPSRAALVETDLGAATAQLALLLAVMLTAGPLARLSLHLTRGGPPAAQLSRVGRCPAGPTARAWAGSWGGGAARQAQAQEPLGGLRRVRGSGARFGVSRLLSSLGGAGHRALASAGRVLGWTPRVASQASRRGARRQSPPHAYQALNGEERAAKPTALAGAAIDAECRSGQVAAALPTPAPSTLREGGAGAAGGEGSSGRAQPRVVLRGQRGVQEEGLQLGGAAPCLPRNSRPPLPDEAGAEGWEEEEVASPGPAWCAAGLSALAAALYLAGLARSLTVLKVSRVCA